MSNSSFFLDQLHPKNIKIEVPQSINNAHRTVEGNRGDGKVFSVDLADGALSDQSI